MKNRNLIHHNNWETPKYLYDELHNEFDFDFDPCPINAKFDGLSVNWGKRNFVNPPYERKIKSNFVYKAIHESKKGNLCVLLLPVSTSSILFHDFIQPNAEEIRFIKGRVKFNGIDKDGNKIKPIRPGQNSGMHDSMLAIFKKVSRDV